MLMTSNISNRLIFFVLSLRIVWAHCKCWKKKNFPPLIQILEIRMFGSLNEFWERCCLISTITTEMFERRCRQTGRKVCIKLSNVIRCAKLRCALTLGLKVIWFNNLIFVKLTWPHPKDSKILCVSISVFYLSVVWYMFYLFSAGLLSVKNKRVFFMFLYFWIYSLYLSFWVLLGFYSLSLLFIFLCSLLWVLVFLVLFWRYFVSAQVCDLCLISSGFHGCWDPVSQISLNLCFYFSYRSLDYYFLFLSEPSCLYS